MTWYGLNNDDDDDSDNAASLVARGRWKGGDHLAVPAPNECKVTEGPVSNECVATATCYTYGSRQAAPRRSCAALRGMVGSTPRPMPMLMQPGTRSFCVRDEHPEDPDDAQCCIAWSDQPREEQEPPLEAGWEDLEVYSDALLHLCGTYDRMSGVVHGAWMGDQCVNACVGKNPDCFKG